MLAVFHSVHNVIGKEVLGSNFQEDNEKQTTGWTEAGFQLHLTTQATSFQWWKKKCWWACCAQIGHPHRNEETFVEN